ncbi:MAG TPA: cupin domain-containing protein [Usitatibacter sp.]|nr:cupin domain-containing protein [Usitatibacter sp.]
MQRKPPCGLDRAAFMSRYWQREPLLVRGAFPGFVDPLTRREIFTLAAADTAISRLVRRTRGHWSLEHGPISAARLKQLPRREWTVLVQDTNHFSASAERLLASFDFIPHARIDDVMVSLAADGGGVGPHVDSYDVFLVQGRGQRRWRISRQRDHAFVPGLDLKILRHFVPTQEWVLGPGDMLYLPPGVAHEGVALGECMTWSVGMRAPDPSQIAEGFLDFLRDRVAAHGRYRDLGNAPATHPGAVPPGLVEHVEHAVAAIRWSRAEVREFAGRIVSEPKAHVFFEPPARPLARRAFEARARREGLRLDARSRLLFSGTMFFLNGERVEAPPAARGALRRLADARGLAPGEDAPRELWDLAHAWYCKGFIRTGRLKT